MTDESPRVPPYGPALREHLTRNLAAHAREAAPLDGRRHAAVAVVVVDHVELAPDVVIDPLGEAPVDHVALDAPGIVHLDEGSVDGVGVLGAPGGPAVLLTRRAARLRDHAGQWALPGGRVDPGETDLDAARRELREELGLVLGPDALVGALDDYPTRSGFVITPFVLWAGPRVVLRPDPTEVWSVHRVSFTELGRADSPRFERIPESDRPVVQIPLGRHLIHAPTGAVLLQFRRVAVEGGSERVSGYEQPRFAWR